MNEQIKFKKIFKFIWLYKTFWRNYVDITIDSFNMVKPIMIYVRNGVSHSKNDVPALNQFSANMRRCDTQHNDIEHNDTGRNGLICGTQHKRHSA